jgi:hypothetical protein
VTLHGLLTNIYKILGGIFRFFVENFTRRSVRVMKLHRVFILTKRGDINPPKNSETPLAPWGAFLGLKKKFVGENFKSCPWVPKLRI